MKTFDQAWAETGRRYGLEELESVRMGWEMAEAELIADLEAMITRRATEDRAMGMIVEVAVYRIGGPPKSVDDIMGQIKVERRTQLDGPDLWAVSRGDGSVFNCANEWEYEPSPSNRDEAFFLRCRYRTLAAAFAAAKRAVDQIGGKVGGRR